MKFIITTGILLHIFVTGIHAQDKLRVQGPFVIPQTFDVALMTDTTRFKPVFDSISPRNYSFSVYDKWGEKVFTTDIPEQGWNGLRNNRTDVCPEDAYMWSLSFRSSTDTTDYMASGFVALINPIMHVRIITLDTIQCQPSFYVPQNFCPNCDGLNDVFIPVFGCSPVEYEMFIYDRWGNAIFRSVDHTKGWDGTLNVNMPADTYAWRIKCRYYAGDQLHTYKGHVELIR